MRFSITEAKTYDYILPTLPRVERTTPEDKWPEYAVEINNIDELKAFGLECNEELILDFRSDPPTIKIYNQFIE